MNVTVPGARARPYMMVTVLVAIGCCRCGAQMVTGKLGAGVDVDDLPAADALMAGAALARARTVGALPSKSLG